MATRCAIHKKDADELGLTGEAVQAYVREQMDLERAERAEERQAKLKTLELESAERAKERESQQKRLELEIELAEKKLEASRLQPTAAAFVGKVPRLPPYQEGEDIEAFFLRLDRFSIDYKWSEEAKLHQLLSVLSGKALTIYHQLEEADQATYEELKQALLKAFDLTTDECRLRFRELRIKPHETGAQFMSRIKACFRKYWKSDGAPQTLEGVLDLIHREAFMNSMPAELVANLNQRKVKSAEQMKVDADAWFDAHGHPCKQRTQSRTGNQSRQPQPSTPIKPRAAQTTATQPDRRVQDSQPPTGRPAQPGNGRGKKNGKQWHCIRCRTDDHWYFHCQKEKAAAAMVEEREAYGSQDSHPIEESRPRWKGGHRRENTQQSTSPSNHSGQ